jgi:hypothetical protein
LPTPPPSTIETAPLTVGTESFGVRFEKWRIPIDAPCEIYEALAITAPGTPILLLKKKYALALADAIVAAFDDDC